MLRPLRRHTARLLLAHTDGGYGGWAPGYGVNDTAAAPHPYWNGAPQAIGPS